MPDSPSIPASRPRRRRSAPARQAFAVVAVAAFAGGFVAGRVSREPGAAHAAVGGEVRLSLDDLRASWAGAIEAARPDPAKLTVDALAPVETYFQDRALPNVEPFVRDMAGFFSSLNLTWLRVRDWWSPVPGSGGGSGGGGGSGAGSGSAVRTRVESKVAESLERRMGMPGELEAAIAASMQRFEALQNQSDARFRTEAYAVLRGAGVRVDPERLDALRREAAHAALVEALHTVSAREAETLAAASIGGLVSSVVVDAVVTSVVTTAVASSLSAGATAGAGGAAAGGAAAGGAAGSAVPVAGTVAGVIVGGVAGTLVYLAADSMFESRARARMTDAVRGMRAETVSRLHRLYADYSAELDRRRAALLDRLLVEAHYR